MNKTITINTKIIGDGGTSDSRFTQTLPYIKGMIQVVNLVNSDLIMYGHTIEPDLIRDVQDLLAELPAEVGQNIKPFVEWLKSKAGLSFDHNHPDEHMVWTVKSWK